MTTDVTNLQNSYQMILRIAVRAPLMAMFLVTEMVAHFSLLLPVASSLGDVVHDSMPP